MSEIYGKYQIKWKKYVKEVQRYDGSGLIKGKSNDSNMSNYRIFEWQ